MAPHKDVVAAYIEGFRRADHEAILACLTDDIVWVLHGYRTLRDKVSRLETFHINLTGPSDTLFTAPA